MCDSVESLHTQQVIFSEHVDENSFEFCEDGIPHATTVYIEIFQGVISCIFAVKFETGFKTHRNMCTP